MDINRPAICSKCKKEHCVTFHIGKDKVECISCGYQLSPTQIDRHIAEKHSRCEKCKSDLVGLIVGGAVVGGLGLVVAAPALISAAGFGSLGIVGGSVAAATQSAVYGGATTGIFSTLTSIGMAGMGAGSTVAAAAAGAAGGAAVGAAVGATKKGVATTPGDIGNKGTVPVQSMEEEDQQNGGKRSNSSKSTFPVEQEEEEDPDVHHYQPYKKKEK